MVDADKWTYDDYVMLLEASTEIRVEVGITRRLLRSLPLACVRYLWPEIEEGFGNLIRVAYRIRERMEAIKAVEGPQLPDGETHAAKADRKGQEASTKPPAIDAPPADLRAVLEHGRQRLERDDAIAATVKAVREGNLADGVTVPMGPRLAGQECPLPASGESGGPGVDIWGVDTPEGDTGDPPPVLDGPDNVSPKNRAILANAARELERQESPDGMLPSERAMAESKVDREGFGIDGKPTAASAITKAGWPMRKPGKKKKGKVK